MNEANEHPVESQGISVSALLATGNDIATGIQQLMYLAYGIFMIICGFDVSGVWYLYDILWIRRRNSARCCHISHLPHFHTRCMVYPLSVQFNVVLRIPLSDAFMIRYRGGQLLFSTG